MFPFSPPHTRLSQEAFTPAQVALLQRQVDAAEGGMTFPYTSVGQAGRPAPELADIQRKLQSLGYATALPLSELGFMGPGVALALRSYQQAKRLPITGVFDRATVERINSEVAAAKAATDAARVLNPDELRIAESITSVARLPGQLREMQSRLQAAGYPVPAAEIGVFGNVGPSFDAKVGPETFRAIQKFQIDQKLPANGVFNRQTSDALERVLSGATATPAAPAQMPSPAVLAAVLTSLRSQLAVQEQLANQFRGTVNQFALDAQVQQLRVQIAAYESMERASVSATSEFGGAPVGEPGAAPARPNYLVPAIVVGGIALLVGGYLLTRPRAA